MAGAARKRAMKIEHVAERTDMPTSIKQPNPTQNSIHVTYSYEQDHVEHLMSDCDENTIR